MESMTKMTAVASQLSDEFATRAAQYDKSGEFPTENYRAMRELGYLAGPVPAELGGLDAGLAENARAQRILARGCASTALAINMHLFQVGAAAMGWRASAGAAGSVRANEPVLRRIVDEGIVLGSTGAEAIVAGEFEPKTIAEHDGDHLVISGRRYFCSQATGMDVVRVNALDAESGEILVVAVPAKAAGVTVVPTWDTLGMRATASHDVVLDKVRVPKTAIGARLPVAGPAWAPAFASAIRWFLTGVAGVYLGIADRAAQAAYESKSARNGALRDPALTDMMFGRLETTMLRAEAVFEYGIDSVAAISDPVAAMAKAIAVRQETTDAAVAAVDLAVDLAGGGAYYKTSILERLVRDVRAARHHPPAAPVSYQMLGKYRREAA